MGFQTAKKEHHLQPLINSPSHQQALQGHHDENEMLSGSYRTPPIAPRSNAVHSGAKSNPLAARPAQTHTVGVKGLPLNPALGTTSSSASVAQGAAGSAPWGANSSNAGKDRSSPLQKLMLNTRYRPGAASPTSALEGSYGGHSGASLPTAGGGGSKPAPLAPHTLQSPMVVSSATRYDLDSSSFASMDMAPSSSMKGKIVGGTTAVSPSVTAMMGSSKPAVRPAGGASPSPMNAVDDDELPAWLKMVNERASNTKGGSLPKR